LSVLATAAWWNFGAFHYGGPDRQLPYVHDWDLYHYYIGAKYFDEFGYTDLYRCTAAADLASAQWRSVVGRPMRDLETNELKRTSSLDGAGCAERLGPLRWDEFQSDIDWFRNRIPTWNRVFLDWGFNATPVWIAVGRAVASTGPATAEQIRWLTLLDVPLIALGFVSVAWAFGWRLMCVLIVFWGTNLPADYSWTGGSLLRHGWFASLLIGVSMLRRGRAVAAGAMLALATLLRIFPGTAFLGLALIGLRRLLTRSSPATRGRTLRTAAGAIGAAVALVALAAPTTGGLSTWVDFARNSYVDTAPSVNNLGLKSIASYRPESRWAALRFGPRNIRRWEQARAETLAARRLGYRAAMLAGAALLAVAALRRPDDDWAAAVLGIGLVPILFDLSSYYHSSIAVLGLLAVRCPSIAVALCALAAVSQGVVLLGLEDDERYAWVAVAWVAFVVYAALGWIGAGRVDRSGAAAGAPVP
jgi:hypothetical protein